MLLSEIGGLKEQLAKYEMERRELEAKGRFEGVVSVEAMNAIAERNKLRRELENLKRSTDSTIADMKESHDVRHSQLQEIRAERDFLRRELERSKKRKSSL